MFINGLCKLMKESARDWRKGKILIPNLLEKFCAVSLVTSRHATKALRHKH